MSCLDATFTLTPRYPLYSGTNGVAELRCCGGDVKSYTPYDLLSLYASDQFFFDGSFASDPNLHYTQWPNRKKARFLYAGISLQNYPAANQKQLALIFGFVVATLPGYANEGRVLVYSDAGLLQDQKLLYGDNQFLLEIESLDLPLTLYFIHAGGFWFFTGLSGYVV